MGSILVSSIIPAHNAAGTITETLQSVLSQNRADMEVIVVDDGSTDGTPERVAATDPRIELIRQPHAGVSAARQAGTRIAQGRYLKYVDADDLLAAGCLQTQIDRIETTNADVVYGAWAYLRQQNNAGGYRQGPIVRARAVGDLEEAVLRGFWCPTAAYLMRRDRLLASGLTWRAEFPILQDSVFIFDLAAAGLRFEATGEVCALYRVRADSLSRSDRRGFLQDQWAHLERARTLWGTSLSKSKLEALCSGYASIALSCSRTEPEMTSRALRVLHQLDASYLPTGSPRLTMLARYVGLDRAIRWTAFLRSPTDRWGQTR